MMEMRTAFPSSRFQAYHPNRHHPVKELPALGLEDMIHVSPSTASRSMHDAVEVLIKSDTPLPPAKSAREVHLVRHRVRVRVRVKVRIRVRVRVKSTY